MTTYEFDLVLDRDPTDPADADRLFEAFDAAGFTVTPFVSNDTPGLACHVEAGALETAMRKALRLAREAGFGVIRVEVEPEAVAA
jgi:hypothetical protein